MVFRQTILLSYRRERPCVCPDAVWCYGVDTGSTPWGPAPSPTAGHGQWKQRQHWLLHAAGLCPQLETKTWRRPVSHTCDLTARLTHTLSPGPSNTRREGRLFTVAASGLRLTGDSAQRGTVRQRRRKSRRRSGTRAPSCSTRGSTGERKGPEMKHNNIWL